MNSFLKRLMMYLVVSTLVIMLAFMYKDKSSLERFLPRHTVTTKKECSNKISPELLKPAATSKCSVRLKKSLNCKKLFETPEVRKIPTKPKSEAEVDTGPKECSLEELVKDCPRLRLEHGYEDKPVTECELEFPLAFAIKMHQNSHQVERLLRTIYRPHNFYCIHVDLKADNETYDLIKKVADCLENVVVMPHRYNVAYASYRLVLVDFDSMRHSMNSNVKWKYYINLTGQEFMLKTNLEIVELLKMFDGVNDIESSVFWIRWRHRYIYEIKGDKLINTKVKYKPFQSNITIFKGSAYGMFSRAFVDFILNDDVVKPVFNWLRKTFSPEECIWATLNKLPFAPGGYKGFLTNHNSLSHPSKSINWIWDKPRVRCYGKFVRGICIFARGDLPWLRNRTEVAANKFYEDMDSVVLDCLEEWVNNKTYSVSLEEFDRSFYQTLPQVKYSRTLTPYQKTREYASMEKQEWLKKNRVVFEE